jgi:DNA polymerase
MTAEEKTALAVFLDAAAASLTGGRRRTEALYRFSDDPPPGAETGGGARQALEGLDREIRACAACGLREKRTQAVPGTGAAEPLLLVVGEGPGAEEDARGLPFVGRAGQLLDRMLNSIGLSRETNCYIANVVKCRPPGNRDPLPEEIAACRHFLNRQIAVLKPRAILCAGRFAAQTLLETSEGIGRLRGRFSVYGGGDSGDGFYAEASPGAGIPLLPTYHPSALLRDESLKRPAWEDLKLLRSRLAELSPAYAESAGNSP